jgi:hypothetical protein
MERLLDWDIDTLDLRVGYRTRLCVLYYSWKVFLTTVLYQILFSSHALALNHVTCSDMSFD